MNLAQRTGLKNTGTYSESRDRERKEKHEKLLFKRKQELEKSRNTTATASYDLGRVICLDCFLNCVSFVGNFNTYLNCRLVCKSLNQNLTNTKWIKKNCNVCVTQSMKSVRGYFDTYCTASKVKKFNRALPTVTGLILKNYLLPTGKFPTPWERFFDEPFFFDEDDDGVGPYIKFDDSEKVATEYLYKRIFEFFPNLKYLNIHVAAPGLIKTILNLKKVDNFVLRIREFKPEFKGSTFHDNLLKFLKEGNVIFVERGHRNRSIEYWDFKNTQRDEGVFIPKELEQYVKYGKVVKMARSGYTFEGVEYTSETRKKLVEKLKTTNSLLHFNSSVDEVMCVFGKFLLANKKCKKYRMIYEDNPTYRCEYVF